MKTRTARLALVWHGVLASAALAALTACQSGALPQPRPLLANTHEESAPIQKEQKERTEAPADLAQVAGASAPLATASDSAAASRAYTVRWLRPLQGRDENDGVEVFDHGWRGGVQLVVTSQSGVGEIEVQPAGAVWPRQIQVQFQYAPGKPFDELERLYLQVDPDAWPGDEKINQNPAGDFVVWQRDGLMRVDLPAGWLQDQQTLHMAWADRLASSLVRPSPPKTPSAK